jgi:D-alanyl-D-alanine dipeptidase
MKSVQMSYFYKKSIYEVFCSILFVGGLLFYYLFPVKHKFLIFSNEANDKAVVNDTTFVNLKDYSDDFVYDMKYATEDNFLKAKSMIAQNVFCV